MVLAVNAAEASLPDKDGGIVGTRVRMGGYVWRSSGAAKRQTTVFGENEEDNAVFVPYRTGVQVAPAAGSLDHHSRKVGAIAGSA